MVWLFIVSVRIAIMLLIEMVTSFRLPFKLPEIALRKL